MQWTLKKKYCNYEQEKQEESLQQSSACFLQEKEEDKAVRNNT